MVAIEVWERLATLCQQKGAVLVAVSKTKPAAAIVELYALGQRDFGENYIQELTTKQQALPADIRWHFIGHLQTNKVKYIAPFVHLIHGVDSFKLLQEISKQGAKNNRVIDVLLQMHIAEEDTKFGLDEKELRTLLETYEAQLSELQHVRICGLMGMASFTSNAEQVAAEFFRLHNQFVFLKDTVFFNKPYFAICSMGMSADYELALANGSTMIRIGSMLFGSR